MDIKAIIVLLVLGALLGAMLGFANKFLQVKEDERISVVTEMLPGANCGGCGFPGCSGFAGALVDGSVNKVSNCVVSVRNEKMRADIAKYLNETPGPDGSVLKVNP